MLPKKKKKMEASWKNQQGSGKGSSENKDNIIFKNITHQK